MIKFAFYTYLPNRLLRKATFEEQMTHNFILDFKDGRNYAKQKAARIVGNAISFKNSNDVVFCCIPASSAYATARRYKKFSAMVCELCGADNAFDHVHVYGKKTKKHNSREHIVSDFADYNVVIDEDYFKGKRVVIFDDLVTTSETADRFKERIELAGGKVIGALFLAHTKRYYH
ncbi:MAG: phosphoribosyltransferase [Prevotella sp.]|nr:phosphoribosyltransferase [Prevotella sp.]